MTAPGKVGGVMLYIPCYRFYIQLILENKGCKTTQSVDQKMVLKKFFYFNDAFIFCIFKIFIKNIYLFLR